MWAREGRPSELGYALPFRDTGDVAPQDSGGPPSRGPLDHQLAIDDLAMLAFAAAAAVGAVVLLALGFSFSAIILPNT